MPDDLAWLTEGELDTQLDRARSYLPMPPDRRYQRWIAWRLPRAHATRIGRRLGRFIVAR